VDIVDIKLMKHKILDSIDNIDLVLILRNRYNGFVNLMNTNKQKDEGVFKNEFIDLLKPKTDSNFENSCDQNKQVLDEERYELKTLEEEVFKTSTKPDNFTGLEPYEMAEFRVGKFLLLNFSSLSNHRRTRYH